MSENGSEQTTWLERLHERNQIEHDLTIDAHRKMWESLRSELLTAAKQSAEQTKSDIETAYWSHMRGRMVTITSAIVIVAAFGVTITGAWTLERLRTSNAHDLKDAIVQLESIKASLDRYEVLIGEDETRRWIVLPSGARPEATTTTNGRPAVVWER